MGNKADFRSSKHLVWVHVALNKIQSRSKFIWILMFFHKNVVHKICALQGPDMEAMAPHSSTLA